ncbi:MAG: hypothetical protein GJ680_10785 [Alteromonadaceae bacterium]|nr:hypothetical protein [Alteromonadaceae bacterium]
MSFQSPNKSLTKLVVCAMVSAALTGCASSQKIADALLEEPIDFTNVFLRGSFSWWEADEKFRLNEIGNGEYAVSVELVADGQPYDFKFADANYTPKYTCGFASQQMEVLNEGVEAEVSCNTAASVDNFKFTPISSGTYQFKLITSKWDNHKIVIIKQS